MNDYEISSEQLLIRKACRGDVKAFSELYAVIYKDLYRFALFTLKNSQDAEDAEAIGVERSIEYGVE